MKLNKYVEEASRTDAPLGSMRQHDLHMVLGMLSEVGELADVFKRNLAYQKPIDWVNVQEEVGDLMWYIVNFCRVHGFDLERIFTINIQKLLSRYPEKFTEENALERNLEEERKVLENGG